MNAVRLALLVLALTLLAAPALAHVPSFPTDNTTPENAVEVPDAAKSWSFYDQLDPGEAAYYRFSLSPGEQLRVSTFTPESGPFAPSFVVMSESLEGRDGVPDQVTVPEGMGAVVVEGERPDQASYEPFAPSANYETASLDRPVDGEATFLVAVYEPEGRSGQAGVAIGYREEFSPIEYVRVPFDLVGVHLWEGQHPLVVVGPFAATVLGGVAVWGRRAAGRSTPVGRYLLGAGALLILGTTVGTLVQIGIALSKTGPTAGAVVTAAYVVIPLICAGWAIRVAGRKDAIPSMLTRVGLVVAAVLSLLTWAGYVVGPALLVVAALLPNRFVRR